jgi:diguanylate cyclase (GGDEF)-like protein
LSQLPATSRIRILLLEDDAAWQHLIATGLEAHRIEVHVAGSVTAAIELLAAIGPDAVLIDAILPESDGFEACSRLTHASRERPIPIVMLADSDDDRVIERAFEAGASDFFVKSLQWQLLAGRLRGLVDASRMRDELASRQRRLDRVQGLAQKARASARRARELVERDLLTDLLDRRGFIAASQARLESLQGDPGHPSVLLLIDIDRFKRINDSLGAEAGDAALREVATRLRHAFRNLPGIILGRIASDEFAVCFPQLRTKAAAFRAAQIVMTELHRPMVCGGLECVLSVSVGIAASIPGAVGPDTGIEALLAQAGLALTAAKEAGGNTVLSFESDLEQADRERFDLEASLHGAVERGELRLHYQPIIDPRTRSVSGIEALMRWQRPDRLLYPDEFIPIAEETGLVFRMGEWAVGEALHQVRRWRTEGLDVAAVSVNIHPRHLEQPELARAVVRALDETRLPCSTLELELTETGVMRDIKRSISSLQGLKDLGVRFALDDFGTGYSSLAYLTQLPIDTLKIDRSFVDKLDADEQAGRQSHAVVRAITALAQALGLSTVAEGVETADQLASLRRLGCDDVQGYLYARPMPAAELAQWWKGFASNSAPAIPQFVPS